MSTILATSVIARLPLAMLAIAVLLHAKHVTGSYAAAGLVAGAYAVASGVGGPLLGRLVDRRGQLLVLLPSVLLTAGLLGATAALPVGAPLALAVVLAAGVGFATPPLGACVRALIPGAVRERVASEGPVRDRAIVSGEVAEATRVAYAVDATAVELTWVAGPPLALAVGVLWSTGAALVAAAVVMLAGTLAFAVQPASRAWRPEPRVERGGSLRAPGMRTLVAVLVAVGVLFGSVEVAVPAANESLSGPLMGLWGLGSLIGGIVATRRGGGACGPAGLALVLAFLAAAHLALVGASGSTAALAAVLFVAGMGIAPTFASVYAMVDRVAPAGTVTEAFAWLTTAIAVGTATGAAASGALVESAGPAASFVLAGGAGAVALLVCVLRARTLEDRPVLTDLRTLAQAAA